MGFEYIKGLLPIHYGIHLGPLSKSLPTKLWMTYLSLGNLPTLREILDPINKRVPFIYLLFVQPYILWSPNSKGQIKDVKDWRMTRKLWHDEDGEDDDNEDAFGSEYDNERTTS